MVLTSCFFYFKELDEFYFMPFALDGSIDFYGRYNSIHPVPMSSGTEDDKKIKEQYETQRALLSMLKLNVVKAIKPLDELKEAGLASHYAEHRKGLYPVDANGVPFTVTYFAGTGDVLADLSEDMAAEEKARAVYESLIDLTNDPDIIGPLLWLRQREIVHFQRFGEGLRKVQEELDPKNFYQYNPGFDRCKK